MRFAVECLPFKTYMSIYNQIKDSIFHAPKINVNNYSSIVLLKPHFALYIWTQIKTQSYDYEIQKMAVHTRLVIDMMLMLFGKQIIKPDKRWQVYVVTYWHGV